MKQNEILKKTLLHYINLEYYANGIDEEFQTLLKELEERCKKVILSQETLNTKTNYSLMYKVVKEEVEAFRKELEERLDEETERIMNEEVEFLDKTYNTKGNTVLKVLGGVTAARLLFAPVAGNETTKVFTEKTAKNILNAYDTSLRSGYLFGQQTGDISSQISNKLSQVSKGMSNGIKTAIPSYAKTTDRIIFLNNEVEVTWVATLDGRTCINCGSLSGMRFKSIAKAPSNPLHWLCRCVLIASDKLTEPVPEFEEFVESLSEEEQKQVLGANRFNLWKEYGVQLKSFLNNGKVISWEELKEDYSRFKENSDLIIPQQKFTEYALNSSKEPNKSRVFKSVLGYTLDNWKDLEENIRKNLRKEEMEFLLENQYGKKYRCDVELTGPNGKTAVVRTGWILKPDSENLQMTTVYVR